MTDSSATSHISCPKCSQPILAAARKCKNCKAWLDQSPPAEAVAKSGAKFDASNALPAASGALPAPTPLHKPPSSGTRASAERPPVVRPRSQLAAVAGVGGLFVALALVVGVGVWWLRPSQSGESDEHFDEVSNQQSPWTTPPATRLKDVLLAPAFLAQDELRSVQLFHPVLRLAPPSERAITIDGLLVSSQPTLVGDTLVVGIAVDSSGISSHFYYLRLNGETADTTRSLLPTDFDNYLSHFGISASGKYLGFVRYENDRVSGVVRSIPSLALIGETAGWPLVPTDSPSDWVKWTSAEELTFVLSAYREDGPADTKVYALRVVDGPSPSVVVVSEPASEIVANDRAVGTTDSVGTGLPRDAKETLQPKVDASQLHFDFDVEKPAASAPSSPGPRYPDILRSGGVEGEVLAQFVVDTLGRVEIESFRVLRSTHVLFEQAVRSALPNMRFLPAEIRGQKVRQLVQQPFVFSLHR